MQFSIGINGVKAIAKRGETILTVLLRNGIKVPTLCCMDGFSPTGSCRMCIVEIEGTEGLVPACSHFVEEWMQIRTHSPKVIKARKTLVELLLANHPDDCLYCDRAGTCELQKIASDLNIRERKYHPGKSSVLVDRNCSSIERDPSKCILCERCIRVCDEVIGVNAIEIIGRGSKSAIGTSYNKGLNVQACVKCGQCIMVCPTDALKEKSHYPQVIEALQNLELYPVIQLTSSVLVSIAEEFSMKPGKDFTDRLSLALKKTGFREIHATSVGADINTMEMAEILSVKIKNKDKSPVFTSCCSSWVNYVVNQRPEFTENLATVKSPQQISGILIHDYYQRNITGKLFSVAVTPCTSKKDEAEQDINPITGEKVIDVVLSTRELIKVLRHFGIDLSSLEPGMPDNSYGTRGSSGRLYGTAGGASESIIRSFYFKMTGQELSPLKIPELRSFKGKKEYKIKIGKNSYTIISVSGLQNAKLVLEEIVNGRQDILMVEVMACPGGCINGGGQRFGTDEKILRTRAKAIHDADDEEMIKVAHKNPGVVSIYSDFLCSSENQGNIEFIRKKFEL